MLNHRGRANFPPAWPSNPCTENDSPKMQIFFLLIVFFPVFLLPSCTSAEGLPQHHDVQCGEEFLCPAALARRVDFWVDVYALHDGDTAIFHDRDTPERVYSVLRREGACGGRRTPAAIGRERKRISMLLRRVADKQEKGVALDAA